MKFTDEEVVVVDRSKDEDVGENCGHHYSVRLVSLEGYELVWTKEQAESLRDDILERFGE